MNPYKGATEGFVETQAIKKGREAYKGTEPKVKILKIVYLPSLSENAAQPNLPSMLAAAKISTNCEEKAGVTTEGSTVENCSAIMDFAIAITPIPPEAMQNRVEIIM